MERSDISGVFFSEISDDLSGEMFLSYSNLFNVLPSWISMKSYIYIHNIIGIVDWGVCLMFSISLFMHYHHARNKRWLARSSWIFFQIPRCSHGWDVYLPFSYIYHKFYSRPNL